MKLIFYKFTFLSVFPLNLAGVQLCCSKFVSFQTVRLYPPGDCSGARNVGKHVKFYGCRRLKTAAKPVEAKPTVSTQVLVMTTATTSVLVTQSAPGQASRSTTTSTSTVISKDVGGISQSASASSTEIPTSSERVNISLNISFSINESIFENGLGSTEIVGTSSVRVETLLKKPIAGVETEKSEFMPENSFDNNVSGQETNTDGGDAFGSKTEIGRAHV